jgi:hypothetical protein
LRAKAMSVLTVVDASGPDMDWGEAVTVFNDLAVLAPGAIPGAPVRWTAVDGTHVFGAFTNGNLTVSAVLTFSADHDPANFVSEDRTRASSDGTLFTPESWFTPR